MSADNPDIRWKQRFQNFDRAFTLLRSALKEKPLMEFNRLEQEGLIQRFVYTYELAWKTANDYLEEQGAVFEEITPKAIIQAAFAAGLIKDGQTWVDMRLHRNLLAHSYDEQKFNEVLWALKEKYLAALEHLHLWFMEKAAKQ